MLFNFTEKDINDLMANHHAAFQFLLHRSLENEYRKLKLEDVPNKWETNRRKELSKLLRKA